MLAGMESESPEHRIRSTATIDVTGLPESVVRSIAEIVRAFRQNVAAGDSPHGHAEPTADERVTAVRAWAASHPKRDIVLDDDRESLYAGRGERTS